MTVTLLHDKTVSASHPLGLREISRNLNAKPPTVLLGWTPPPNVVGYLFFENGVRVSVGTKPSQSQTNFKFVSGMKYGVTALSILDTDELVVS